jgi:hypothetical protein
MGRSKGDGARIPLAWRSQYRGKIADEHWKELGKSIEVPQDARTRIQNAMDLYAQYGPIYSPECSLLASKAKSAIKLWLKATETLTSSLTPPGANLTDFLPRFDEWPHREFFRSLSRVLPVTQVAAVSLLAQKTAELALDKLSGEDRSGRIEVDQWAAWACIVTKALRTTGLKISGKSLDKSNQESVYVNVMQLLQSWLPSECQRHSNYESMRKGLQTANKKFGRLKEKTLIHMIAGWGSQLVGGYPGNLKGASDEVISHLDGAVELFIEKSRVDPPEIRRRE